MNDDEELRALAVQMKAMADRILAKTEPKPDEQAPAPRWVTLAEFALRSGYSKRTLSTYIALGMPCVGEGRGRKVILADALAWIERGGPTLAAGKLGQERARRRSMQ